MNAKTEILTTTVTLTEITDLPLKQGMCLTELLALQATANPDKMAVTSDSGSLSYQALVDNSKSVASYLQHLGALADDCIGVFTEPSLELMIGIWGILFSGAAYLPLSPEYPEERLRYMIEDSRIKIIFCQTTLKDQLLALVPNGTHVVTLDDVANGPINFIDEASPAVLNNRHQAYVIYTSGSTGKPKGVVIEHLAVVNQLLWLQQTFKFNRQTVILQKTPMSFDAAQWEILAPCFGGTVVMGQPGIYRDPEAIIDTISRYGVTTFQCVPTLLQAMLDLPSCQDCQTLIQVFSGGEILTSKLAVECFAVLPQVSLINLYGPTECTINASAHVVDRHTLSQGSTAIAIGKPVANTHFYILNEQLQPVLPGKMGELYIGGIQLARGYLHKAEMTDQRFIASSLANQLPERLYKTGDLAYCAADGTYYFCGRADNQVKLRGFRVELDEIRLAIEEHSWVKSAAMLIKNDVRNHFQNLIACIELNPKEAALMDQGNHDSHHQTKANKHQVKAQMSNPGVRDEQQLLGRKVFDLPGKVATEAQSEMVFARKSYRFFEGGDVSAEDIVQLLDDHCVEHYNAAFAKSHQSLQHLTQMDMAAFGEWLRYFGCFVSEERLLSKYGYASPGALYASQMYFELHHIGQLMAGIYYYHPLTHQLVLIRSLTEKSAAQIKVHFLGKKSAIEPVYKNNILEVLEIEAGHMLGLFDHVLPQYGLAIGQGQFTPAIKPQLDCAAEDYYLGSFDIVPATQTCWQPRLDIYVQTHAGKVVGLPMAKYRYQDGKFSHISGQLIQKKHVIAINQQVYDRSSFGISIISRDSRPWIQYIDLGRKLQHLQMNDCNIGLMSSGYSSKSGNDLPSATHMGNILKETGDHMSAFYFCIGGRVSEEQLDHRGMKEDAIHMKGPTEMLKDDLTNQLPSYMVPNKIIVVNKLPQMANGKVDHKALADMPEVNNQSFHRPFIAPRTQIELQLCEIWKTAMKWDAVSVQDDFFESGGNSLIAVAMVNKMNQHFGCKLPLQILFEAPTVEKLARHIEHDDNIPISRLVPLNAQGEQAPIFCWPGLGGYPMNLRLLASRSCLNKPFYGVQAFGINPSEQPYPSILQMAMADIEAIKRIQPKGPYTLWGYSFGSRVAFETAWQLECLGETVEQLCLIAPGSPKLDPQVLASLATENATFSSQTFDNEAFVTILYSVFSQRIDGKALADCLAISHDQASFGQFICDRYKHLDPLLVDRIVDLARLTYDFKYTLPQLSQRPIKAPITIIKAQHDDDSFLENLAGDPVVKPNIIRLNGDHYSLLKEKGIDELVTAIHQIYQQPTAVNVSELAVAK